MVIIMHEEKFYSIYKSARILKLYTKLISEESIVKSQEAEFFQVNPKTIQRDIDELRAFFENQYAEGLSDKKLVYNRSLNCYQLQSQNKTTMTDGEVLAVCKILLESRAFCKDDIQKIIQKILNLCISRNNRKSVKELVANELLHYVEPRHGKHFIDSLWDIGTAIQNKRCMNIKYKKQDETIVERKIQPVAIMFSEYYFYLTAFIDGIDKKAEFNNPDDIFPTIYRVDRIEEYSITDENFSIPYRDRFQDGEFRKRIQFMYGGTLRKIKFRYLGKNVDSILDRLPTAKIIEKNKNGYLIYAEVFGNGIDMWLRSQGEYVEVIKS